MSFLKAASAARTSAPSPTPSNASGSGGKRKRPEESATPVVYSQPQETGTGSHIYTQLTYAIEFLRQNQKWMTFKEIMEYLNVKDNDPTSRQHLTTLFRSNNPQNRISYNYKDNTYRYKPKFDVRNTAQLKGYFQKQKSSQGLSVKDLKDGWANVHEDLKEMEAKQEVLVKRNMKDQAAKTVWGNDPSLMHNMDPDFMNEWHRIQIPANPDDLRNSLLAAGLKPSSAPRQAVASKPDKKKRKAPRRGGKQTNTHMQSILKDFSHMRK